MPKGDTPTLKQRKFVKSYLRTGNGTAAALEAYDTDSPSVAESIGSENLSKPIIRKMLEDQSELSLLDNISIREELKASKEEYAVRFRVNADILDRAGYGKQQGEQPNLLQINVYNSEQARKLADRVLQTVLPEGEG